jgi:DNA-binding MarR family transcriptional regulator
MEWIRERGEAQVLMVLARVERRLRAQMTRRLDLVGLTLRDYEVMQLISEGTARTPGGLARACGVSRQFMHRRIEALEEKGFVQRWRGGTHDSEVRVGLTQSAEEELAEARVLVEALMDGVLRRFGVERRGSLNDLLHSLERAMGEEDVVMED